MSDISGKMRAEWNARAREDAHYYVAFGSRNQDQEGFESTGQKEVEAFERELKRFPKSVNRRAMRAIEIGCGPGRLMKPLSRNFGEIHGVDVSDEMVRLARERLRAIPHAHVHATNGSSLEMFADESFDFAYSYAVFQHIPSREIVLEYMREIGRVLKPGGIFRGQFNGIPPSQAPDTWGGVSFSPEDIRAFTRENGLQLLALDGPQTQYMWTTWRKRQSRPADATCPPMRIRRITNAFSSEPVVPNRGLLAALSLWVTGLPDESDLDSLDIRIDGASGTCVYIGHAETDGLQQVNVMLPEGVRTGLVPVEMFSRGEPLGPRAFVRVIPAPAQTPRILQVTDGINIVQENRSTTGSVKVLLEANIRPELMSAKISGRSVRNLEVRCTDPLPPRYELNFRLPDGLSAGRHQLRIALGRRELAPMEIEVEANALA